MNNNTDPILELKHLSKSFDDSVILKDINMAIYKNDVISIIGPSGTGKSTLLRCLNLMETPSSGDILYHRQSVLEKGYDLRHFHSKVGMVFQQFNLFENLSVLKNCTLGQTKVLKRDKITAKEKALQMLEKVNMENYAEAMPSQLSGGQKQRVAIARTLAMDPEVLLFDEPTSALDPEMTGEVLQVIEDLAKEDISMVIVSHEMSFAKDVSTKVCFLNQGVIEESGEPETIFQNPQSPSLKQFLSRVKI